MSAESEAKSHTNTVPPPERFNRKFQLAWMTAAARTRPSASAVILFSSGQGRGRRSGCELGTIAEMLERLGIGERLDVFHRLPVNDVAHGELHDLAALGARYVGDLHDARRHVPRRR